MLTICTYLHLTCVVSYLLIYSCSGTEKQHVADDYAKRLHIGEVECRDLMSAAFNIMAVKGGPSNVNFTFCEYLNISICPISETGEVRID